MLSGFRAATQLPDAPILRCRASPDADFQHAAACLRQEMSACVSHLDRLATSLTEYLLIHGETEGSATFDLWPHLGGRVTDYKRLVKNLNAQHIPVSVVEVETKTEGENAGVSTEEPASKKGVAHEVATTIRAMTLPIYPAGSGGRAVVTGFTLRLLLCLKPTQPHRLMCKLEPTSTLENEFYVRDVEYRSVDEAVKRASKQQHLSVTALPPETYFDIAEAVCLYNKLQYWALLASSDAPIHPRPEASATPIVPDSEPGTNGGTSTSAGNEPASRSTANPAAQTEATAAAAAESKPKLVTLWRDKWFEQLALVRRLILHRDFGAFFEDCPYLPLAGRFPMEVPEMPPLKPEDRQGSVFEDILRRVDRNSVTKFIAFLQRASHSGRAEHAIRQAKAAGVIRAIGDAVGSIRTPIKTVDLCFQALTIVAQRVPCNRMQSPHFSELFPSGFGGDLLEHGFVSGSGRGDDAMGVTIPALIIRNFLHRRDAWAVLSQLHPSFVHITERIVQEAARRALPQHFTSPGVHRTAPASEEKAASESANIPTTEAAAATATGVTQYRSSEDVFMVASAAVILSHAVTNPNAKRSQLLLLRPCLRDMIRQALDANRCGNCKISGWSAQTHRLSVAMIRMAAAVVRDWVGEEPIAATKSATSATSSTSATAVASSSEPSAAHDAANENSSADGGEEVASQPAEGGGEPTAETEHGVDPTSSVTAPSKPPQPPTTFAAYPGFVSDMVAIIREAAHVSCLMNSAMDLLEALSSSRRGFADAVGDDVDALIHAVQVKFIDDGFLEDEDEADGETAASGNAGTGPSRRGNTSSATVASVAIKDEVMRHTIAFLANVCVIHAHSDAGSVLISLGVHHCVDWGLNVVRWVNKTVSEIAPDDSRHGFASRLALTTPVVYAELFQQCGAAAVVEATHSLLELLRVAPGATAAAQRRLLPAVLDWLKKPLWDVVEEDDDDKDDDEQPEDTRRRLHGVRNTILCVLLDAAKALTAEYPDRGQPVEELFSRCVDLVGVFGEEVAYLNPVLQCVLNLALCGVSRAALFGAKATLMSVSEASKASDKLVQKFVKLTEAGKTKTALTSAPPAAQEKKPRDSAVLPSGGDSTDRMEYIEHNHNIFQRLVATPSASAPVRTAIAPEAPGAGGGLAVAQKQSAAAVPKGFTLISNDRKSHHSKTANAGGTAAAATSSSPTKKVRTSESLAKNAQRRSDRLRASQSRRDLEHEDEANEKQNSRVRQAPPDTSAQGRGAGRGNTRHEGGGTHASTAATAPPTGAAPSASSTHRKGQHLVNVHGGSEGINLDLLSVKIAHSLNRNSDASHSAGKPTPTSWAHMAKHAMSREQREDEMAAAQRAEELRLTRLAAERAEMRQRLQQQQQQQQREEAEQKRRDAERVQQQPQPQHDARRRPGNDAGPETTLTSDVHALLNKILPKPANVVRREESVRVTRLISIDEDASAYDDSSAAYPPTSAIAASLAQLRIGGHDGSSASGGGGAARQRTHQISSEALRISSQESDTRAMPQRSVAAVGTLPSDAPTSMPLRFLSAPVPSPAQPQPPPQQPQQQQPQPQPQPLPQQLSGAGVSASDAFLSSGFAAFHQAHQQAIVVTSSQSTPPSQSSASLGSVPASNIWHAAPSSTTAGRGSVAVGSPEMEEARARGGLFGATVSQQQQQQQQQMQMQLQMLQAMRQQSAVSQSGQTSAPPSTAPQQNLWGSLSVTAGPQQSSAVPHQTHSQLQQQHAVTVGASYAYRPPHQVHVPQQQQHLSYLNPSGMVGSGSSAMTVTGYQQTPTPPQHLQQQQQHLQHPHMTPPQQQAHHLSLQQQPAMSAYHNASGGAGGGGGGSYALSHAAAPPAHLSQQQQHQQQQQQAQHRSQPMVSVGGRPSVVPWPSPATAGSYPQDRSVPGSYTQSSTFGAHLTTTSPSSQQAFSLQHQAAPAQQQQQHLLQQYHAQTTNRGFVQSAPSNAAAAPSNPYGLASSTSLRNY